METFQLEQNAFNTPDLASFFSSLSSPLSADQPSKHQSKVGEEVEEEEGCTSSFETYLIISENSGIFCWICLIGVFKNFDCEVLVDTPGQQS